MTLAGQSKLHGHRPATLVRLVCGHNEENHDAVAQATLARALSPQWPGLSVGAQASRSMSALVL